MAMKNPPNQEDPIRAKIIELSSCLERLHQRHGLIRYVVRES
jgi:hypothetical protein